MKTVLTCMVTIPSRVTIRKTATGFREAFIDRI